MELLGGLRNRSMYLTLLLSITIIAAIVLIGPASIILLILPAAAIIILKAKMDGRMAFLFMTGLLYINMLRPVPGYKMFSPMVEVVIGVFILKTLLTNKDLTKKQMLVVFIVSAFMILSLVQMINPNIPSLMAGVEGFRKTSFAFILFFVGLMSFKTRYEVKRWITGVGIVSAPILLYGIKQFFFPSAIDMIYMMSNSADVSTGLLFGKSRATSFFAGPFHFSMFAAIMAVVYLWLADMTTSKKLKLLNYVGVAVSILACYCSLVRTNLIALLIAVAVYLTFANLKRARIVVPLLGAGAVYGLNYLYSHAQHFLFSKNELLRLLGTVLNFENDTRLQGRTEGWKEIIQLIKEKPFFGYGTGSAGDTLQNTYTFQHHVTSHNFFLKILMETGVEGFILIAILFVVALLTMFSKIFKKEHGFDVKLAACCLAMFAVFLVNTATTSAIETYPVSAIVMFMLALPMVKLKEEGGNAT